MLTGQIFIQLIVILLVVQVFGDLCQRIGQPRVIGEILAGLALGPTLLGAIVPRVEAAIFPSSALPTFQTLGDIGLTLYMFSLGTHIDTHAMLKQGRKAIAVSLSDVLLPLALGGAFALFLYPRFAGSRANLVSFMLLVGTAMAITAFPVLARLLQERGMLRTKISIGLDLGVISPTFFAILVIMAVVTTMMASPLLPLLGYRVKNARGQEVKATDPTSHNESLIN